MAKGFDILLGLKLRELNRRDEDHGYFRYFPNHEVTGFPRNPKKKSRNRRVNESRSSLKHIVPVGK